MIIIGRIEQGFVISLNYEEIANILGFSYNTWRHREELEKINVGDTLNVHEMYEKIRDLKKTVEFQQMAKSLRRHADCLEFKSESLEKILKERGNGDDPEK